MASHILDLVESARSAVEQFGMVIAPLLFEKEGS